jgi:membrane-associated protein
VQTGLELFEKRLFLILVFGRMIPLVRSVPSLIAGAQHIKFSKYITYNFLGSMLWSIVGVTLGMATGKLVGKNAISIIIIVTIVVIIFMFLKHSKKFLGSKK